MKILDFYIFFQKNVENLLSKKLQEYKKLKTPHSRYMNFVLFSRERNADTMLGSNCFPEFCLISSTASSVDKATLYGLS